MFGQSLLSAFGSAACTTDTDQLFTTDVQTTSTATYQFNNATTSIPSNTYPGVASNITYAAGKFGNAAVLNGSSSFVTLPDSSSISQQNNFSLSFWIKPSGFVAYGTLINLYSDYRNIVEIRSSGIIGFNATGSWVDSPSSSITDGVWQHIAITKSSTAGTVIYVNGSSVVTDASNTGNASDFTASGYPNTIGAYRLTGSASYFFPGSIDQFRIFSSVLSQAAVTALYNETTTTATYPYVDYESANPNSIAYYKMSDATDQLGNYNGTASNVNFNTEGKFGFAGAFNGSSSYITLPDNAFNLTTLTVSVWINVTTFNGEKWIFDGYDEQGSGKGFGVTTHTGDKVKFRAWGTGFAEVISNTVLSTNTWYNVTCVATQSEAKVYINGSLDNTGSLTGIQYASTQNYGLGAVNITGTPVGHFTGKIDQIRIYNSAISAANVTSLYEEIECPAVTSDTYLVVGGGAGSGSYGGGGAGGYLSNFNRNSIEFTTGTVYTITVGAGGTTSSSGGSAGTNGDSSVLSGSNITTITASGGGYGGNLVSNINANSGASGGGGGSDGAGAGGAASPAGQGNAGGIGAAAHPGYSGGGGGGAGAVGNAGSGATGGNGGVGIETSITGTATYFAGGGGGTGYLYPNPGTSGTGGSGGGGTANPYGSTSTVSNATPNTGGGGGGNGAVYSNGSGGSGIVVLRYSSTKSITIASGNLSTGTLNTSIGSDKYTTFIGGTGTVTFS